MITRRIETEIMGALGRSSSVALIGPRQVGKTTIALHIADTVPSVYLDLEDSTDIEKARDITAFHAANKGKLIIMDEVQRMPGVFAPLRGVIDRERRAGNKAGQFLFLGSASIDLLQQSGESLAGRIAYIELHGIDALEYAGPNPEMINTLWLRGGFPESLLAASDKNSLYWRRDFIKTYLERDIPQLGPRIPALTLERFWTMLSHNQGAVINASTLARSLEVSSPGLSISANDWSRPRKFTSGTAALLMLYSIFPVITIYWAIPSRGAAGKVSLSKTSFPSHPKTPCPFITAHPAAPKST